MPLNSGFFEVMKAAFAPWPINVLVILKRGGGTVQFQYTKAKRLEKSDGTISYKLKQTGKEIRPPDFDCVYTDEKGKPWIILATPDKVQYYPTKINLIPIIDKNEKSISMYNKQYTDLDDKEKVKIDKLLNTEIRPLDKDMQLWNSNTIEKVFALFYKPSFIQKYGTVITIVGIAIAFAIMTHVTTTYLETLSGTIGALANAAIEASSKMAACQPVTVVG